MKKFTCVLFALVLVFSLIVPQMSAKATGDECQTVNYEFTTYDNGMGGLWAVDYFKSKVTLCPVDENTYTVIYVDDESPFATIDGNSPGGNGPLASDVIGTINGGITRTVEGVLKDDIPSNVGPIDYRGMPRPINYEAPFFDSITSNHVVSWGWDYLAACSGEVWHDNELSEALYDAVGPNAIMGDITLANNCLPPPEEKHKSCSWARDVIEGKQKYKDEARRYMKNHPTCQFTFRGYYWYWAAHPELMKK